MDLTIEMNLDNDAFIPDFVPELRRILIDLSDTVIILTSSTPLIIRDRSGRTIGSVKLKP